MTSLFEAILALILLVLPLPSWQVVIRLPKDLVCLQKPPETGCSASSNNQNAVTNYYFDKKDKACQPLNFCTTMPPTTDMMNRFVTKDACQEACPIPSDPAPEYASYAGIMPPPQPDGLMGVGLRNIPSLSYVGAVATNTNGTVFPTAPIGLGVYYPAADRYYAPPQYVPAIPTTTVPVPVVLPLGIVPAGVVPSVVPVAGLPPGVVPAGMLPPGIVPAGVVPTGMVPAGILPAGVVSPQLPSVPFTSGYITVRTLSGTSSYQQLSYVCMGRVISSLATIDSADKCAYLCELMTGQVSNNCRAFTWTQTALLCELKDGCPQLVNANIPIPPTSVAYKRV